MLPDDPRHGTGAGWSRHRAEGDTPCDPCRQAWNDYRLVYCKERALGYARRVPADHGGAWGRIDALRSEGHTYPAISAALGIGESHAWRIHNRVIRSISPATWHKIMSLDPRHPALSQPTHIGTVRRARALAANGWPGTEIQRRAGLAKKTVVMLLRGELRTTEHATRRAIAAVYDELWDQQPPPTKHTVRAQRRAAREGWAKPLCWDSIDDPDEQPTGMLGQQKRRSPDDLDPAMVERLVQGRREPDATKAEKVAAMTRWLAWGRSEKSLCRIHGWKDGRYVVRERVAS